MNVRSIFKSVCKLLGSALAALLIWVAVSNSPLWPRDAAAQHHEPEAAKEDAGHAAADHGGSHHEPNAVAHVMDANEIELIGGIAIPLPYLGHYPLVGDLYLSKFMILELIAAGLICVIYIPLAKKIDAGGVPRGPSANFFEVLLTFIRDQVAKPSIGEHDADKFVPFLWTLFLFILFNNLLGMVPFGGSATASLFVTAALALIVFGFMHGSGVAKMGVVHYIGSLWPHMDVPFPLGYFIKPLIFGLEWLGVVVRNVVLAVRLFANMFAGHTVLATLLIFIYAARNAGPMWYAITAGSVLGILALSLLELFVAFLQAYIFTFLTALFMGMALHPEH
jgi:F-type H+-transporting ATPase subunit a